MKLNCKVAGDFLEDRQTVLREIYQSVGCFSFVDLVKEENNKFDPFAVAVTFSGKKIGYIPRVISQDVCECMSILKESKLEIKKDSGGKFYSNLEMDFQEA